MTRFRDFWNDPSTVASYSRPAYLYPPELHLLGLLRDRWPAIDMLDLGVGAGRTSAYFAGMARSYVGVDFAPSMIARCRERFSGRWPHADFRVADASSLKDFANASFDLVLFSFNGIDYLNAEGRAAAILEMRRVCRSGGWIVFSTHNFYCLPRHLRFRFVRGVRALLEEWRRYRCVRRHHPKSEDSVLLQAEQAFFVDAASGDDKAGYVKPDVQAKELRDMGFKSVEMYSCVDGRRLVDGKDFRDEGLSWVYFFCAT